MTRHVLGAVVLSGGSARRMGGVRKTALEVGGQMLLTRTAEAALAACDGAVVVVGDATGAPGGVIHVVEESPGGGPVAGLAAGMSHLDAEWTLLLAGDLVDGAAAVSALVGAQRGTDGAGLVDAAGKKQWLCALVRTEALRATLSTAGTAFGARLSEIVGKLEVLWAPDRGEVTADIDTWDDLTQAHARFVRVIRSSPRIDTRTDGGSAVTVPATERTLPPEALDGWAQVLRERFGLTEDEVPIALILDLARDVAHDVARPAAPLSAFIAGLIAGRQGGGPAQTSVILDEVTALARAWATATATME
ncbi:NTP transferase domain-containing protein [Microbacterium sediminicola]|uniref:NTP transferase domain-containing protein n=1 Tax=Microbacterium sediminicola TaxID=415210 RepID=A0ABN2HH39_9MICO